MNATIDALRAALHAQRHELASPVAAVRRSAVAQQLLHHAQITSAAAALRDPLGQRLAHLAAVGERPLLATRWSSSLPRHRLIPGRGGITTLDVARDGRFLLFTCGDGVLCRWTLGAAPTRPEPLGQLPHLVSALALAPSGRMAVTGDHSGGVTLWELSESGASSRRLGGHSHYVRDVAVDEQTGVAYSVGDDAVLIRWEFGDEAAGVVLGQGETALWSVVAGGGTVYTGDRNGIVQAWPARRPGIGRELGRHDRGSVSALAFAGDRLVSAGYDGTIRLWSTMEPNAGRVVGRDSLPLWNVAVTGDGKDVVAGGSTGLVYQWPLAGVEQPPEVVGWHDRGVTAVAAGPALYTGAKDGFIMVWERSSRPARQDLEVWTLAAMRGGARVVTGGSRGMHRWETLTGNTPPRPLQLHDTPVSGLAAVRGDRAVSIGPDGRILLWDPERPEMPPVVVAQTEGATRATAVAAIPGSEDVLVAARDGTLRRFGLARPGCAPTYVGTHLGAVVAVAPDGSWAASAGDDSRLLRWSLTEPASPLDLGTIGGQPLCVIVSPYGDRIFTGDAQGQIRGWEPNGYERRGRLIGRHTAVSAEDQEGGGAAVKVRSLAVAADQGWLASVADDGTVRCWDLQGGGAAVLVPAALSLAAVVVPGGVVISDRHGGLTAVDVLGVPAASPPPVEPGLALGIGLVVVLDHWWCNRKRGSRLLDLAAMRATLTGDRPTMAWAACPDLPALKRFREYLRHTGWQVRDVPARRPDQVNPIADLVHTSALSADVVLVGADPAVVNALDAVPGRDRITVVDNIDEWVSG